MFGRRACAVMMGGVSVIAATASCGVEEEEEPAESISEALGDPGYAQRKDIYDFLVMDVCTTGGPNGAVDRTRLPHECRRTGNNWRNLSPVESGKVKRKGDPLYYRNHNILRGRGPAFRFGHSGWSSYPVEHDGVRRVVLVKDHGRVPATSEDRFGKLLPTAKDGVSVRWMGNENAFMSLTVSPGNYGYAVSKDACGKGAPDSLEGYWHMPKDMPSRNGVWSDIGWSKLFDGRSPRRLPACDKIRFNDVLNTAVHVDAFAFTGGMRLETIVHHKFSGASPEDAEAIERIYFTREYGITRWEHWRKTAEDRVEAKTFYDAQLAPPEAPSCSRPFEYPTGGGVVTGALGVAADSGWSQPYKKGGPSQVFYMVDCEDFTGRIIKGNELEEAYGDLADVKWSFKDISGFLAQPVGAGVEALPAVDTKRYFFSD